MHAIRDMTGAGEHHVLEHVREPGSAGHFVLRSHVIPHIHCNLRNRVIGRENHIEAVRQGNALERNVDRDGAWLSGLRICRRSSERDERCDTEHCHRDVDDF